ncbi:MAG: hypothetical protein R3B89_06430 [Polyangiaceae bacterium]
MKVNGFETKYELFVDRFTEGMEALCGIGNQTAKSSQVLAWVEQKYPDDIDHLKSAWGSHLSAAAVDPNTRFRRVPGKYTYELLATPPSALAQVGGDEDPTEDANEQAASAYTKREAALYPALRDWLAARRFRADISANSKGGGVWGNPDVAGLRITSSLLGQREVEVATIEAKWTLGGWRQSIFEAVSHKRFANRAYFAFALGTDEPGLDVVPDADAIRTYAERFGVGILVIFLSQERYEHLKSAKGDELDLSSDDMVVQELCPAIRESIPLEETHAFLTNVLSIASEDKLYAYGT